MTLTDQIKILNRKIKQNDSQYDLDREAAKISVLSSNSLDKYELLTGEDLGFKPSTIEQTKFEYSPLGKVFNKVLSKDDNKEGLFKRLENVKNKNEELINTISTINKVSTATTNKTTKNKTKIQSKDLIYDSKHSLLSTEILINLKNCHLHYFYIKLNKFKRDIFDLKGVSPRKKEKRELKNKVLPNGKKHCNELYYIYKEKYNKEINSLDTDDKKSFDYKNSRLSDYTYLSEKNEEEQEEQQEQKQEKKQDKKNI